MRTVAQTITHLEMTAREQLVPAARPATSLELEPMGAESLELIRSTCLRIGEPHHWSTRPAWSTERWHEHLSRPAVLDWIARADGEVAGMVELELQARAAVEITILGLVPELVGRGLGGHLLTLATRLAWDARAEGGPPTRRVWLHTSSLDHPHALPNYERRGFRVFRRVSRPRPVPGSSRHGR
ncbi:MAG: GNAT family N-acetyltransferase [Solirubrobacterales bacterium]|nr:GNAT family N-acetyltransferase [Solirubrobacterales bacterium]